MQLLAFPDPPSVGSLNSFLPRVVVAFWVACRLAAIMVPKITAAEIIIALFMFSSTHFYTSQIPVEMMTVTDLFSQFKE